MCFFQHYKWYKLIRRLQGDTGKQNSRFLSSISEALHYKEFYNKTVILNDDSRMFNVSRTGVTLLSFFLSFTLFLPAPKMVEITWV